MEKGKVFNLLEAQNWPEIIRRLTYYAVSRARIYNWNSGDNDLPKGKTPEDIACDAIEKVWTGTRTWDPEKYPDLLQHLKWIVKSDMGHLLSSSDHQLSRRGFEDNETPDAIDAQDHTFPDASSAIGTLSKTNNPEEELIAKEKRDHEEQLKRELYEFVKGDEDLEILLVFFEDGIDKPETIATEMAWDITKVNNLKRKLFRKASMILSPKGTKRKG